MIRPRIFMRVVGMLMASTLALAVAAPSFAGRDDGNDFGGENTEDGFKGEVGVNMNIDGENIPGGSESISGTVPAKCLWNFHTDNPKQFKAMTNLMNWATFGLWGFVAPSDEVMDEAIDIWDEGDTPVSWYTLDCIDNVEPEYVQSYVQNCAALFPDICFSSPWGYFVENTEPPVVVEPEELALAASEYLEIPEPAVDRNPKMGSGAENATLVNLPTWFWVTDSESVGGDDGEISIRAEIPEANVWVEVTAQTSGLSLSSPAGSTTCDPQTASTQWSEGAADSDGCTVSFQRASVDSPGGFPVTATTQWSATWTGSGPSGNMESGELDPVTSESTVNVPVAESQAVVTQ